MKRFLMLSVVYYLFLTTNIQAHWSWQYPIPQGNNLNDLTFTGSNQEVGFAVGNFGVILKSIDRGNSWILMDSVTSSNLNGIRLKNATNGCIVGDNGVILRLNNQGNWIHEESGSFYNLFNVAFASDSKLFAVGYKGLILKSGGSGWTLINTTTINTLYGIDFATPDIGIIVGENGYMLRTSDGGQNWTPVEHGFTQTLNDVYFTSENIGYVAGNNGLILKTTDGGQSWTDISYPQAEKNILSIHFNNDTTGYATGASGLILFTPNGGTNWIYQTKSTSLAFRGTYHLNPFVADTVCDTLIFCGDNGLIMRSDTCFNHRNVTHSSEEALNSIAFTGENKAFAVGGHLFNNTPLILKTEDGANWSPVVVDTITRYLTDVFFLNPDTGYISARNGNVYRTFDNGSSWIPLKTPVSQILYSVRFVEANTGFAVGGEGTVIKTISGDTTWQKLNSGTVKHLYKLHFKSIAEGGFAVGADGIILHIKNGGNQIVKIPSGTTAPLYDIKFPTDTAGYIVGYAGKILRLRKTGNSFETVNIPSGVTTPLNEIFFPHPDTGYIVGEGGVVLKSTDGGSSWLPQNTGTSNNLRGTYFKNSRIGYAIGSGPSVIYTSNGGGAVITPAIPETKEYISDIRIYPNPASDQVQVEYDLLNNRPVSLNLYDFSGRLITRFPDLQQTPGRHTRQFDLTALKKGLYILVLEDGISQYPFKLIKH